MDARLDGAWREERDEEKCRIIHRLLQTYRQRRKQKGWTDGYRQTDRQKRGKRKEWLRMKRNAERQRGERKKWTDSYRQT